MIPPFMDVAVRGDVVDLPLLKLRELLFVGALRREGDVLVRDASRPLPPFRLPGLFPPGSRFAREDHGARVHLRRLPSVVAEVRPGPGDEAGTRAEAVLPAAGPGEAAVSPWSSPSQRDAVAGWRLARFEHVFGGPRALGVPDGDAVLAEDGELRFVVAAPGSPAADALRRAGYELIHTRVVMRAPSPPVSA